MAHISEVLLGSQATGVTGSTARESNEVSGEGAARLSTPTAASDLDLRTLDVLPEPPPNVRLGALQSAVWKKSVAFSTRSAYALHEVYSCCAKFHLVWSLARARCHSEM